MAYRYSIDATRQLATVVLSDLVTGDEFVQAVVAMLEDAAWQPGYNSLWDGRLVTALQLEPERAAEFVKRMRAVRDRRGTGKTAVVVSRDLDYTIARFFSLAVKQMAREIRIFQTLNEALKWLDAG